MQESVYKAHDRATIAEHKNINWKKASRPVCRNEIKRVALITGASGAIGVSVARFLAKSVEVLYLGYRKNFESVEQLASTLDREMGVRAHPLPLDLLDRQAGRQAVEQILSERGRLDILVHCAGVARDTLLIQTKEADFADALEVHVSALFRLLQASLPAMRRQGYGRIVAFTSYAGVNGRAGQSAYSASKAALIGLVKAAALEEIEHGITINAIAPSVTDSAMIAQLTEAQQVKLLQQIPLGRTQSPAEAAALVEWLVAEGAASISGQVLTPDNRTHRW